MFSETNRFWIWFVHEKKQNKTEATQGAFTNLFSEMLLGTAQENYFEGGKLFKLSKEYCRVSVVTW
jgi:hypothetical protein